MTASNPAARERFHLPLVVLKMSAIMELGLPPNAMMSLTTSVIIGPLSAALTGVISYSATSVFGLVEVMLETANWGQLSFEVTLTITHSD